MKKLRLLIPAGILLLSGCMTTKPDKNAFYTPAGWEKPIQVAAQGEGQTEFFPQHRNYGNSPKVSPLKPMNAGHDFVPDFGSKTGGNTQAAKTSSSFAPTFGSSAASGVAWEQMEGKGSWYGPGFHGKKTANGERYNQKGMTAAHRILPMGTWVRVTNQENGQSVVVRINDRGPYKKNRVIDLTETAATRLGYAKKGTAAVKLEVVRYPKDYDPAKGMTPYKQVVVQMAVFSTQNKASSYQQSLKSKYGSIPFIVDEKNGSFYVVAGPYSGRDEAGRISRSLKQEGLKNFVRSLRK